MTGSSNDSAPAPLHGGAGSPSARMPWYTTMNPSETPRPDALRRLFLWDGIALIVLGTVGLALTTLVSLATILVVGAIAAVAGVLQVARALKRGGDARHRRAPSLGRGLLYLALAAVIAWDPVMTTLAATLVVAGMFVAIGVHRLALVGRCRRLGLAWGWDALLGIMELAAGVAIALTWPDVMWVIGFLVSVEFLVEGWILVAASLAAKRLAASGTGAAD